MPNKRHKHVWKASKTFSIIMEYDCVEVKQSVTGSAMPKLRHESASVQLLRHYVERLTSDWCSVHYVCDITVERKNDIALCDDNRGQKWEVNFSHLPELWVCRAGIARDRVEPVLEANIKQTWTAGFFVNLRALKMSVAKALYSATTKVKICMSLAEFTHGFSLDITGVKNTSPTSGDGEIRNRPVATKCHGDYHGFQIDCYE